MNNWLIAGIATVFLAWLMSVVLGTAMFTLTTIALSVFILLLLQKFGIFRVIPLPKRNENMILAVVGIAVFLLGGFSFLGLTTSTVTGMIGGVAPVLPGQSAQAASCAVSPEITGKQSTITVNAYDQESDTPYASAVDVQTYFLSGSNVYKTSDTSAYSLDQYSAGSVVSWAGGDSSYYLDSGSACIDKLAFPLDLDAHAVAGNSNMQIIAQDDTGATTLSTGTNTSLEDYKITLGASQSKQVFVKLSVNAANKAFRLSGIATAAQNDIESFELTSAVDGPAYTQTIVPKMLKNINLGGVGDSNNVSSFSYDNAYRVKPKLLSEWDSVKYQFEIISTSTDPATTATFSAADLAIVCFLDGLTERGDDGQLYDDFYKHNSDEDNVGMIEAISSPVGKTTCTVIEGV